MHKEFETLKNSILSLIRASTEEVLPSTKIKKSGIYMIYIDFFDDEKIIPIYIGKTVDIQRRYKSHYNEILSLNRLGYDEYKKYTENGFYDGSFKSCKIFKYMIEHNCSLKNYHMIPLELCNEDLLEQREQYYINKYKSEYFGFNQLNSISLFMEYRKNRDKNDVVLSYLTSVKNNALYLKKYWGYGFTVFNYEYGFYKSPLAQDEIKFKNLQALLEETNTAIDKLSKFSYSPYAKMSREITNTEKDIYAQIHEIETLLEPADNKIERQQKVIRKKFKQNLNYSPTKIEFDYFIAGIYDNERRKLFNDSIKKKKLTFLAYVRLKKEISELKTLHNERENILAQVEEQKSKKYDELNHLNTNRKLLKSELRLGYLLPAIKFMPFSLKDCKRINLIEENTVLFVLSNNGKNSISEVIAVYINIGNEKKTYFVKNKTTTHKSDYIEKICIL